MSPATGTSGPRRTCTTTGPSTRRSSAPTPTRSPTRPARPEGDEGTWTLDRAEIAVAAAARSAPTRSCSPSSCASATDVGAGRLRVDGVLTDRCAVCGAKMNRKGFRGWIDAPVTDAPAKRIAGRLGLAEPRETQRVTWHPTKKDAEAWAKHERRRGRLQGEAHMSTYAAAIAVLAPDHDPAHVEAWMRLEHPTLDAVDAVHFAREVVVAVACIQEAGREACDELAHSYGLQVRYAIGDRVLVSRDEGLAPATAAVVADNEHRPQLIKVQYEHGRRSAAWVARTRLIRRVGRVLGS